MKCDRDCFHCPYEDCICDDVSTMERIEQIERDMNTQTEQRKATFNKNKKWRKGSVWNG